FDPKDVDYLEVQRGSYSAEYGDRTYAAFNVVPRTGFERNNQAELITSFGNFYQTNDQINFGSHSERFAYYASLNGNRSNLGLETPTAEILHDRQNGYGGFGSLIWNLDAANQLRLITSLRRDYYQIPITPGQYSDGSSADSQHEADAFANFSWVHTFNSQTLLTVSPFYHYNRANYDGGPNDFPVSTLDHHSSEYAGGQAVFSAMLPRNSAQIGVYGFAQRDIQNFGLTFNDGSAPGFVERAPASGNLESLFLDDKFRAFPWLTITAGMRPSHFCGSLSETAISPRFGAALEVPRLRWTFRAFYGHYYQAPPLITVSGPLLQFAQVNNSGFIPLRGESDEEHQFGVNIPVRGWTIDLDNFRTSAENFFDHNNVGESDIFFPLTISRAIIRGWEATLRSPMIARRGQMHLAYSNQVAEGALPITGGLTDFSPPSSLFLLDHDQRNTLNVGGSISLPLRSFASTNVYYGSGFTDSGGPAHLPAHTTFDVSLGKDFAERLSLSANVLNAANRHLLTDNSLTFGGTHWNNPREIFVELRYKFHY
ncbi:MAG: TonB-dependent receptor, partial [Acidobacteriales bacterium]|nr:TonB-dependent receptor [Terriglobales bacterium]